MLVAYHINLYCAFPLSDASKLSQETTRYSFHFISAGYSAVASLLGCVIVYTAYKVVNYTPRHLFGPIKLTTVCCRVWVCIFTGSLPLIVNSGCRPRGHILTHSILLRQTTTRKYAISDFSAIQFSHNNQHPRSKGSKSNSNSSWNLYRGLCLYAYT